MSNTFVRDFALREFVLGAALGASLLALVVLLTYLLVRRGTGPRRTAPRGPAPLVTVRAPSRPSAPPPSLKVASPDTAERRALVDGLADLALRLPAGLDREAVGILARAGVQRRSADGLRFDPAWQDALGAEPSADPAAEGMVIRTVRDFFDDRGRPASRPQVVVLGRHVSEAPRGRLHGPVVPAGPTGPA